VRWVSSTSKSTASSVLRSDIKDLGYCSENAMKACATKKPKIVRCRAIFIAGCRDRVVLAAGHTSGSPRLTVPTGQTRTDRQL
jgi:hypothetical protein